MLVRNAVIAFLIFIALESLIVLVNWKRVNWEVVTPTVLSLAASFGIWGADRYKNGQERKAAIVAQFRAEQDAKLEQRQAENLKLIETLGESIDSLVISLSAFESSLAELKRTDAKTLDRLAVLETDLETHRDRWAHQGAEESIQKLQQSMFQLKAQVEGLAGILETQKRIDVVAESVNNVNAEVERLRHVVRKLPGIVAIDEKEE